MNKITTATPVLTVSQSGIFLGGQRGHFAPTENGFAPLDYASMIKLILIYKNHKIYRLYSSYLEWYYVNS